MKPLLIASAPNGATKTRAQHRVPITPAQIAVTAAAVHAAGARMLHLHVRDAAGKHTLDVAAYRAAVDAVREQVGDDIFIQLTSEAASVHTAAQQRAALYAIAGDGAGDGDSYSDSYSDSNSDGVDGVSIALRELIRGPADRAPCEKLFHHLTARAIAPQYILFSRADINTYAALLTDNTIPAAGHSVLLVVGRYAADGDGADELNRMVAMLHTVSDVEWMVCAFGDGEFECLTKAVALGGHARVGFENAVTLRDGKPAADNRELVTQLLTAGNPTHRPLADIKVARAILGKT